MPWAKIDDDYPTNGKVTEADNDTVLFHLFAIFFCAKNLTDGMLTKGQARSVRNSRGLAASVIDESLRIGFLEEVDGGYRVINVDSAGRNLFSPDKSPGRALWDRLRSALAPDVLARDGHACRRCGRTEDLTVDHMKPLAVGGDSSLGNLQTLCRSCNSRKSARYEATF